MSIENPDFYPEEEARKEAAKLQEKIKSGEASSYNEAEKLVEKEKLENTIKELENLTKIEKLERQDIEPHLNKALELLQNEPETIRPKDKNNRPGGLVELKKDKPVLLIPDLHGKREMLFKILTEQNEDGKTNLERFLKNELQIVILGDAVHTEDSDRLTELKIAQNEYLQGNKQKALELLDKEIADSFGTTTMLMKLKELSPDNFHYLRGDHEVQKETYFDVGKRNVHQSSLVKFYFENKYGADFLDKYDKFEESLPLVALGNKFVASHAPHFKPFTKEEIINFHASLPPGIQKKSQFFKDLTVFRLGEDPDYNKNPSENVTKMLQALGGDEQWVYYFGHTYDDVGWDKTHHLCGLDGGWAPYFITAEIKTPEELIVRYHSSLAQVNPKRMWGGNVYDIEQHSPKKTTLIDMEKLSQKRAKLENLLMFTPNIEKVLKQTSSETQPSQEQPPTKQQEQTEKEQNLEQKTVEHFKTELLKIKDLPDEKEWQKYNKAQRTLKLIEDWVPFGFLDNFQGIEEAMDILNTTKPKTMLRFNYLKENIASKIALEMAFQYKANNSDKQTKNETIVNFVNKWLKDESAYYQFGESIEKYLTEPPEKYSAERAKETKGYSFGENTELQGPELKSVAFSLKKLFQLTGRHDRTLAEVAKLLASQQPALENQTTDISYPEDIKPITDNIENTLVKTKTLNEIQELEEKTQDEKLAFFLKEKERLGIMPKLPLKQEFYENILLERIKSQQLNPEQAAAISLLVAEAWDKIKNPQEKEKLQTLKNTLDTLKQSQEANLPKAVKQAAETIAKQAAKQVENAPTTSKGKSAEEKKKSFWENIGGLKGVGSAAGMSLFFFILLAIIGEIKLLDLSTGGQIEGGKKK